MASASEVGGAGRRGDIGSTGCAALSEDRDIAVAARSSLARPRAVVRAIGIAIAIVVTAACAPMPAADATSAARDGDTGDADPENEANDAAPTSAASDLPVQWIASELEGAAVSKTEHRPMLVHFAAEWCSDCKRMAKETFGDPRFQSHAGRFVAVRIDATNEDPQVEAAFAKYAVMGVPTLIVLDSRGREQRRFTDFIRADQLLGAIEQVR